MEILLPLTFLISDVDSFRMSTPSKRISPPAIRPGGRGTRRMMELAVTVLPQPDSPTSPKVSPASIVKLTSSTALRTPPRTSKYVLRLRTSRRELAVMALIPQPRVQGVTQAIAEEVKATSGK